MDTQKKESVMLELVSDKQLTNIKNADDVLFTGKIAIKEEGGFKKLYDLPGPSLLDRCTTKYDSMKDILAVRFKHYGWLCNRDSGWSKHKCVLFAKLGLIFIYVTPVKGYVLKLSFGTKLEVRSWRKKILPVDIPPENCVVKIKFGFGAFELQLTKTQAEKWRQPLLNAFDGNLPCFEPPNKETPKIKDAPKMVDVSVSTRDIPNKSIASLSDTDSVGVSSLAHTSANLSTCSEASELSLCSTTFKSDEGFKPSQRFLAPLKEVDDEVTEFPEMVDSLLIGGAAESEARENDSGFGANEEIDKSTEEFRPIPSPRSLMFVNTVSEAPSTSGHTSAAITPLLPPINEKISARMLDTSFDLPVYRLETEREKLSRREPHSRIAEKIRYFEEMLNGTGATEARFMPKH